MVKETVVTVCLKEREAVRRIFYKHHSSSDLKAVRKKISGQEQRQELRLSGNEQRPAREARFSRKFSRKRSEASTYNSHPLTSFTPETSSPIKEQSVTRSPGCPTRVTQTLGPVVQQRHSHPGLPENYPAPL